MNLRQVANSTRILAATLFAAVALTASAEAQGAASMSGLPFPGSLDAATRLAVMQLAAGTIPDGLDALEGQLVGRPLNGSALRAITELGFGLRGTGPALRATTDDPAILLLVYQAARDTAGVRQTIRAIDAARSRLAQRNLPPPLTLAGAELSLGDSTAALNRLLAFETSWTAMEQEVSWGMVQNGWLLERTWQLLGDLAQATGHNADAERAYNRMTSPRRAAAPTTGGTITLRAAPTAAPGARYRYDATLWMQPAFASARLNADRPIARLAFLTSERVSPVAGGYTITQSYDSVIVDMPLLDALGAEGLTLRRQLQSAAGAMTATNDLDSLGHTTRRALQTSAQLPDELRAMLERGLGFGPLAGAVALPSRVITVGDTWQDSISLVLPGGTGNLELHVAYRLARITTVGDHRQAFIILDAATREITLTGELVRDLETGENLRLAVSLRASGGAASPVRVLLTARREAGAPVSSIAMR